MTAASLITPNSEPQAPDKGLRFSNFTLRTTSNSFLGKDQVDAFYHDGTARRNIPA